MIVGRHPRIRQSFQQAWSALTALFFWDLAVTIFYFVSPFQAPALPLTIFGTALALVLGFRVNSAYARWWEGRILWGAMVNVSRSYARAVLAYLPDTAQARAVGVTLVKRHVAYVHALRCQLRREDPAPDMRRVLEGEGQDVAGGDLPELARRNPANGVLDGSDRQLMDAVRRGWIDTIQHSRIEGMLIDMSNAQGGMERIKNTPLPAQYRAFPKYFTRLFCILLPIGLVETLGIATPIGSAVAGFMFLAVLQIGDDLVDPFGNDVHDLPLTSITTTIEADMNQAIGLPAPPPLEPVDGVLW
ncbi:bestrophin family ion channel [Sphingobium sp. CR2-8]|uniref:bestrophin family protein n=1 Tax=Sphingobium sp. CR2-8 TaxID=1306534 RepID=UPI002DB8D147|nr:bestrophin family ion channel [Sphingobium sp. CR2-8]MEC3912224.1 bestrophin family ion channel [Sphingobium sp. CR2-8]